MPMFRHNGPAAVAGDWHGSRHWGVTALRWLREHHFGTGPHAPPGLLVHVGDLGVYEYDDLYHLLPVLEETDITLLHVKGNHENHELLATLPHDPAETGLRIYGPRAYHVPNSQIFMVNQLRWMALGGAHSIDRHMGPQGVYWWPEEVITGKEVRELERRPDEARLVDVLVTHEAPLDVTPIEQSIARWNGRLDPALVRATLAQRALVTEALVATRARWLFHGHHHLHHVTRVDVPDEMVDPWEALDDEAATGGRVVALRTHPVTVVGLDMNDRVLTRNLAVLLEHGTMRVGQRGRDAVTAYDWPVMWPTEPDEPAEPGDQQ